MSRYSDHARYLIPAALLFPFLVGFDPSDSTGTYIRASGGHGGYHLSGCRRSMDSKFYEGRISAEHRFAPGAGEAEESRSLWKPRKLQIGYFFDAVSEELVVTGVDSGNTVDSVGDETGDFGWATGAYLGMEWKWVGLQAGVIGLRFRSDVDKAGMEGVSPMGGLRLGPEFLYASAELFGSRPLYSGGGALNLGLGGKWRTTRLWAGLGWIPYKSEILTLRLAQPFGTSALFLTGMVGGTKGNVGPAGLGIDNEYAFSLGWEMKLR